MLRVKPLLFFCGLISLFTACGSEELPNYKPSMEGVKRPELSLHRMEQRFFQADTLNLAQLVEGDWAKDYPDFLRLFGPQILALPQAGSPLSVLDTFLREPYARALYDSVQAKFPDLNPLKNELELMLQRHNYYFPEAPQPQKLYTFISLYNSGAVLLPDALGLGLDFFLGAEHPGYMAVENLRHDYVRRSLSPEHMLPYLARVLSADIVEQRTNPGRSRLIDLMVYEGKKMWVASLLLPDMPDSLLFGFSAYQEEYCRLGEQTLYDYIAKEINFFSDDFRGFRKYVEPGPFSPAQGLPGNSGTWMGMRMLKQYEAFLRKNSGSKNEANPSLRREADRRRIEQILAEDDPQKILQRYKPPR